MTIRKLRKFRKIKRERELTDNEKSFLEKELTKIGNKSRFDHLHYMISDLLDLIIPNIKDIKPNTYVVDINFNRLFLVEGFDYERDLLYYKESYDIRGGEVWSFSLSGKEDKYIRTIKPYSPSDDALHGGVCSIDDEAIFRKVLDRELSLLKK